MESIKVASAEELEALGIEESEEELDSGVKFKLDKFEGPLDLLLHLIKDAKIDIKDIFISTITEQFLEYINEFKEMPVDKVGDFIEMAATLIEIKSKKLLPPPPKDDDEEEEDPEKKLIRQLEEYKLFKEQSQLLSDIENVGSLYKEPEPLANGYRYELKDFSFDKLLDAFALIMHKVQERAEIPEAKQIEKDRFTVAQKMADIKDRLLQSDKIMFSELYMDDYSKSEVINTFLALLELLKTQLIKVVQDDLFSEICIEKNNEPI